MKEHLGAMELFCILIVVVFTQCLCLLKIIQLYFKKGVFTPCKLYTNETD